MNTAHAYVAGVLDSDGCIRINRRKTQSRQKRDEEAKYLPPNAVVVDRRRNVAKWTYNVEVLVAQTQLEAISLIRGIWGGACMIDKRKYNENYRPIARYRITSNKAAQLLIDVYPYLRIKKRQAELCLGLTALKREVSQRPRGYRRPDRRDQERFAAMFEEARQLNARGVQGRSRWAIDASV